MNEKIIYSGDFTDADRNLHYFNTGRDNVSGLSYPTHYVRNKDNYSFTRILNIKLSPDTSLLYPIHQCFLLTTFSKNNVRGLSNIITVDAIVKNGTIKPEDIKVTCTPLNHVEDIHSIKVSLQGVLDTETGGIVHRLNVWLNTADIIDIVIKDLSSLAYNDIPNNIYHQFLQCDYQADYLDNERVVYDINMFNYEESIGTILATGENINQKLIDKLKMVAEDVTTAIPDYQFLSVIYDDMYTINETNVDENISPTSFQYVQPENNFAAIKDNYIQVKEKGNYLIALKVDMKVLEGLSTHVKLSVFINDDRIEETTSSLYLNPANDARPHGFISGQFQALLKPSDKIYLKARWAYKSGVNIENHCTLQITKLNKVL